jgi:hypothetical protein
MPVVNLVRNSVLNGIVNGSPGTLPTNWSSGLRGATQTLSHGIDATTGLPYIDWGLSGTPTAGTMTLPFDTQTGIACSPSTQYTASFTLSVQAGSASTGITAVRLAVNTLAGGVFSTTANLAITPTGTPTPFSNTMTTGASDTTIYPSLDLAVTGVAIAVTFRIYGVQIEAGAAATAFEPTPITNFGVSRNGVIDDTTPGTSSLIYSGHVAYRSDGTNYWNWTGTGWAYFGTTAPGAGTGTSAIAYSTGANPGTNPTTNGFPSPLPQSAMNSTFSTSSPLGWTVDASDDFTGTFTLGNRQSTWQAGDPVLGSTNSFTTGATYNGNPIAYGCYPVTTWGGYGGIATIQNIGMANSLLTFNMTNVSGTIHGSSASVCMPSPWGYTEWSVRANHGANGSRSGCNWGLWFSGTGWPSQGEFDVQESSGFAASSGGLQPAIHCGPVGSQSGFSGSAFAVNTLPGGHTWDDGNFHVYGALITPSYLAAYVDGTLTGWGANSGYLNNLSTTTDPPFGSVAGSFGYRANVLTGSYSSLTTSANSYTLIMGYVPNTGASTAICPTKMDVDWWRHSKLFPASGGPHV